jgi:molecular chaperone DnaK (HSP70)
LLEKESEIVCFFDMGDTQTQCAVMRYSKGKLEVLGYAYDHHLGGRNFTAAIVEHFRQEWIGKYKIDVATNARARLRTTEACQSLKHILSSNMQGNVNLDCLLNDKDVSGKLERDKFVEMVAPLLDQILLPVQRALDAAGIRKVTCLSLCVIFF